VFNVLRKTAKNSRLQEWQVQKIVGGLRVNIPTTFHFHLSD